jgi:hypothetical protein
MMREGSGGINRSPPCDEIAALTAALLAAGTPVRFIARGGSMAPFIRDGEPVLLEPLRGSPCPGEVVLRRGPDGDLMLHRVARVSADGLVTRGDATAWDDPPVGPDDVLGRVVEVSGRRRLHLRPGFGRLVLRCLALSRGPLAAWPLRLIARCARSLAARLPAGSP